MNDKLSLVIKENNIAEANAKELLSAFGMPLEEAGAILIDYQSIKVTEEGQLELMAEARTKRLKLKEIRVAVEKKRKNLRNKAKEL